MSILSMEELKRELLSNSVKNVILDTDAYNEIDDLYAIAYAMLSKERVRLLSISAAPFLNMRAVSPADGMEKSYREILRIMKLVDENTELPVYRGSTEFMVDVNTPVASEAAANIVRTVTESDERVYIVAIGAITNVASAILMCPEIKEKAVVVWLGGHALHWKDTKEFNMRQDIPATKVVFDSGIPLVQLPCCGVVTEFLTTLPELHYHLDGKNALCDYLVEITEAFNKKNAPVWSKVIWDVTAVAAVACPEALDLVAIPTPRVTSDGYYAFDSGRHPYLYTRSLKRNTLFADLFRKLAEK